MITKRPAIEADKAYLKRLFRLVYQDVVTRQFGQWDAEKYDRYIDETWPEQRYEILQLDGEDIGAIWVSREPDHVFLKEIQIDPRHQNKGIGRQLLDDVLGEARAAGLQVRLRVLKQSRARVLYERLGFAVTGEYKGTHVWMECR